MQAQKLTRESWSEDGVNRALQVLIDASETVKASPSSATRNVKALLEDMTGQSNERNSLTTRLVLWVGCALPAFSYVCAQVASVHQLKRPWCAALWE